MAKSECDHRLTDPEASTRPAEACDIALDHEIDLILCHDLELLADALPKLPSSAAAHRLCDRLSAAASRLLDPRAIDLFKANPAIVEARHLDATHADDVIEAIWARWRDDSHVQIGQLAYMLRAWFDGRKRAIALEKEWLGCAECHSSESD